MAKFNVHMPYSQRNKYFQRFIELKISPEIYFTGHDLDNINLKELENISSSLYESNLKPSVHAPFLDINISATDSAIVEVTKKRLLKTIEVSKILEAQGIVIHPGFDPYRFRAMEESWLSSAKKNLEPIINEAEKVKIPLAVENIFDEHYEYLKKLINYYSSPFLGHCFDTGHFNIFAKTSLEEWLSNMNSHIFSLHLHDNLGYVDQHLPVGEGSFPFNYFFTKINGNLKWQTLEMHNEQSVFKCIQNITNYLNKKNE
ncbi:MAG: sugar phosphate isomerase/epimerase [Proteobacteria bacterium]|nr:sugar phosphate isomerase/epimerase [Pseudomonadota bacterium]